MTIEQFGQTIKQKYPQYADLSDADLGQKMLGKYPQYSDLVQARPDKEKLAEEQAILDKEAERGFVSRFGEALKEKTSEAFLKTPARFIGSAAKVPADVTAQIQGEQPSVEELPFGLGKTYQARAAESFEQIRGDTSNRQLLLIGLKPFLEVPLAGLETLGTIQLAQKGLAIAGRATKTAGKKIFGSAFDITAREAPLLQAYRAKVPFMERLKLALSGQSSVAKPITQAETALRQPGLTGTQTGIGIRAKRAAGTIWNDVINPELKTVKEPINMRLFFKELRQRIIKETPELGRRKDLLDGLAAMQDDYARVGNVSYPKLQTYKEGWAKFVPEKVYRGKPVAGAFNDVKNMAAEIAREKIYTKLGDPIKQAYLDYGNLKGIQELGQKAMTEGKFKGGFGSFVSATYDVLATPVKTIGGKTVYRVGQGIEFIGSAGARTTGEILTNILIGGGGEIIE